MARRNDHSGSTDSDQPGWSPYEVWRNSIHEPRMKARRLRAITHTKPPQHPAQGKKAKRSWRAIWSDWGLAR